MALVTGDPNVAQAPNGVARGEEPKAIEGRSLRQIALGRLKRDKWTMLAMAIAGFYVLVAVLSPLLVNLDVLKPTEGNQHLVDPANSGAPFGRFGGISADHLLGVVPQTGWDLLSRLAYGVTFSVIVGLGATIVAILIGLSLGMIAGFSGGWVDAAISRVIDLVLCFPQTLMLLALSTTLTMRLIDLGVPGGNIASGLYVILVLGLFGWPTFARIVRGQVMTLRNREFVEAARSLGATRRRMYVTELLPNLWAPILVYSTLTFPVFVSAEAALSFLGVGIKSPTPTLGNVINDAVNYSQNDPAYFFLPIVTIVILVLSFNLTGDGLRDALDPKADRH